MKKRNFLSFLISIGLISIVLLSFPYCGKKEKIQESKKPKVIKIGAIVPLTGNLAFFGEQAKNAALLLQNELNKEGEEVEIKIYDSKSTPKDGLNAYKKLILEDIRYLYVSLDPVAKTILPQIEKDNVILFVGSVDNDISKESSNIFRLYYGFKDQTLAQLNLIISLKKKKVSMLLRNVSAIIKYSGNLLGKKLKENGINIGRIETFEPTTKDFKDIISRLDIGKSDTLVMSEYGPLYPSIFKELRLVPQGIPTTICGLGMLNVKKEDYYLYEEVIFASPAYLARSKENQFYNIYVDTYKSEPHYEAYYAYDSLKTLFIAVKNSINSTQDIIRYLLNNEFTGVSQEKIKFDNNGDLKVSTILMKFKNGEIIEYDK